MLLGDGDRTVHDLDGDAAGASVDDESAERLVDLVAELVSGGERVRTRGEGQDGERRQGGGCGTSIHGDHLSQ